MAIEWNSSMSTGIDEIDVQHKELIRMLNALSDAMRSGKGKDEIEKILIFAGEYAQQHFACEERYFVQYHCDAAAENRAGHAQFITRFNGFMQDFREKGSSFALVMKIYSEFSNWLVKHILGVDVKLREVVKAQRLE
jgi:hemerythrin-like metal-binding protein